MQRNTITTEQFIIEARNGGEKSLVKIQRYIAENQSRVAQINQKNFYGNTALINAAMYDNETILDELLSHPETNINASNKKNETALHCAASRGKTAIVKALLKKNADVTKKNCYGRTAAEEAQINGHHEVVAIFWEEIPKHLKGGQYLVLNKLAAFLKITQPDNTTLHQNLLGPGFCYGFSLCHFAMDVVGKLEWWKALVFTIIKWDENPASLNQKIFLPGSIQEYTLRYLFERALNYIVTNQACSYYSVYQAFLPTPSSNVWDTMIGLFEIQDIHKIKKIENSAVVAGYFTFEQLENLLEPHEITHNLCLIASLTHIIRVSYKNSTWILYDASQINTPSCLIHQTFHDSHKKDFIGEIIRILGNSLVVGIATLEKNKTVEISYFNKLMHENLDQILRETGLHLLAQYAPHFLPELIALAEQNSLAANQLARALSKQGDLAVCNGLQKMTHYLEDVQVLKVLNVASKALDGPALIIDALIKKNNLGMSGFDSLSDKYDEEFLGQCIHIILKSSAAQNIHDELIKIFIITFNTQNWLVEKCQKMKSALESLEPPSKRARGEYSEQRFFKSFDPSETLKKMVNALETRLALIEPLRGLGDYL